MSYRVDAPKARPGKWYLIKEEWEKGKRRDRRIPKDQYLAHGFLPSITAEEAKAKASQLNKQTQIAKKEERKKVRTLARSKRLADIECAYLPPAECTEFEEMLRKRFGGLNPEATRYLKVLSHWAFVKRMLKDLTDKGDAREPSHWSREPYIFYNYFQENRISPSYVVKVIRILNQWGDWQCSRAGKYFRNVECPRGRVRSDIEDSFRHFKGRSTESEPLTFEILEKARASFTVPGQFEFLYVAIAFGLRPSEVERLADRSTWEVYRDKRGGVDVLRVYQGKLRSISRDKRYKRIPVILPEQRKALELIHIGNLKRPLTKTLKKAFKERVTLYGPRKGFLRMMLDAGQDYVQVSRWLGHKTIDTTARHYEDDTVEVKPIPEKVVA